MKMTPSTPSPTTKSRAERSVFNVLQALDLGPHCRCFHSLNLTRHSNKRFAEADFVVVHPKGLFVLEVKGGGVTRTETGTWRITDKQGTSYEKQEGPFEQAHGALMALRKRVEEGLGGHFLARVPLGYGVLLPNCRLDVASVEWEPWMVADSRYRDQLGTWLRALMQHWRARVPDRPRSFSESEIDQLCAFLRPAFDRPQGLHSRLQEVEEAVTRLTASQVRVMDCLDESLQILCKGGAGTGKTFLAAELARRWSREGADTLVVASSPWLIAFLKKQIRAPGVDVRPIQSLRIRPPAPPYARLIVDEGQDLLNADDLDVLERCVEGGLAEGRWALFYDSNNQAGVFGAFEQDALDYLRQSRPALLTLSENCRNTETILSFIQQHTQCDMGVRGCGEGPEVEVVAPDAAGTAEATIRGILRRLMNEHIAPGEITLLSAAPSGDGWPQNDSLSRLGIIPLDEVLIAQQPYSKVTAAHVADFKGLENKVIILTDLDKVEEPLARGRLAYVGMSRARTLLILLLNPGTQLFGAK